MNECESPLDYRRLCTCRRRFRAFRSVEARTKKKRQTQGTLEDMLTCFEFFFPLVYDNMALLEELSFDFVGRQSEQNVIYTEVRYSPNLLAKNPEDAHAAITRGLRRGCEEFKVIVNQILCAINFSPAWSGDVVDIANAHRNSYPCAVVGVDVAAGEDHFSRESPHHTGHYEMCQKAKELGINLSIHAGETPGSAEHVRFAIEEYGAKRIGHAYKIASHDGILELVQERNIHIESCPTSSIETGGWKKTIWSEHPCNQYWKRGISVSLSSDDPAVFNTSLTWQYRIAMKKMGWGVDDVLAMVHKAIDGCFADEQVKSSLRDKMISWQVDDNPSFDDRVHYD